MARGIVLPSPNSVLALAGIMRCSAHSRGHQSFQSGRTEPVASLTELDGIGLFRWEVLDLAKAGFPEHAGDLIRREERGEVDIAGCEKRLFRLGLGSGHYETEDDFRPGAQPAAQRRVSLIEAGDRYWVTASQEMNAAACGAKPTSARASAIELRSKSHGVNRSCFGVSNPSALGRACFQTCIGGSSTSYTISSFRSAA
jgi:hypothetical protein